MSAPLTSREVLERLERLDLPFNQYGMDPYGISKRHLGLFLSFLELFYRRYFRVQSFGIQNVPDRGAAMLVGNHSGGIPADGGMVIASLFLDHEPPRLAHGMVEKFAQEWPFVSQWFSRVGQLPGLPEHAVRLLRDGRLLMVFPEGARGTGKLYKDRYQMVRFGTGFMRIALQSRVPIVPMAFIGGEEALPTIYHAKTLAKIAGAPYWPVPPYLVPMPMPLPCELHYGEPLRFEGTGNEADHVIEGYVERVRAAIEHLIAEGREVHQRRRAGVPFTTEGSP
ncbi:MAG TPA: lysophospholipid acyltransferase family protein [Nannocystaceae bacterium]|nr:lysophospholipid acyltransferase family protein [Nannocystaceae bacterium]